MKNNVPHPFYVTENMSVINLEKIESGAYSEILVRRNNVKITSNGDVFKTGIVIDSGISCEMTIENVNIKRGQQSPVITLKENTSLTLNLKGDNKFGGIGIYVPESADLTIKGDGNLKIDCDEDNACGIGTTVTEPYGNITVDMTGKLDFNINGISTIAIGGGSNPSRNKINLVSGGIFVCNTGKRCVSVGNTYGNAVIEIGRDCCVDIENSSNDNVSVGSMEGTVSVVSNGNIKIIGSGDNVTGIGVLENGTGIIDLRNSTVEINFGAKNICCIGTHGGSMVVRSENSEITLSAGGDYIVGIGDFSGGGTVSLKNNKINMRLKGDNVLNIGSPSGTVVDSDNNTL